MNKGDRTVEISVIVPMYNVEKYIQDCLDSLERQTFQDFETIIVDDGSTDASLSIAQAYAEKHERVTVISKPNEGPGMTRNRGLSAATGKYIYFVDSDDYIEDNTLELAWQEAEATGADMVLFSGKSFHHTEEDQPVTFIPYSKNPRYPETTWDGMEVVCQYNRSKTCFCSVGLQLVRREVICRAGLSFGKEYIAEDEYYSFQLMMNCRKVRAIPAELYCRRIRPLSIVTSIPYGKHMEGVYTCLSKVADWCASHEIPEQYDKGLNDYMARLWRMAVYELYFKMSEQEQQRMAEIRKGLLMLSRRYQGFGDLSIWGISMCWPLYSLFRRIKYRR